MSTQQLNARLKSVYCWLLPCLHRCQRNCQSLPPAMS